MANPYNFIRVLPEHAVTDSPVWFNDTGEQLHSGKLYCTMKTLTPTIVGNYQYKQHNEQSEHNGQNEHNEHNAITIIEPLKDPEGRVIIPGSSIKGMLRNSIAALCSAPLERVSEQIYGYRPNQQFGDFIYPNPCIITGKNENGDVQATVFTGAFSRRAFKRYNPQNPADLPPGISAYEYLGSLTRNVYRSVEVDNTHTSGITIPKRVWEHYIDTLSFLSDDKHGHVSSRHPDRNQAASIKRKIEAVKQRVTDNFNTLVNKVIFFVEVEEVESVGGGLIVNSIGHHFRYLTRYRDSIHCKNGKPRRELSPLECEKKGKDDGDFQLSAARLLFGVSEDSENPAAAGIGGGDNFNLIGRVFINHALEQLNQDPGSNPPDNDRFFTSNGSTRVYMKVLGGPKPSAAVYYLTQGAVAGRNDMGTLCTYGDTLNDNRAGSLRGRKFYYHQEGVRAAHFSVDERVFDRKMANCCKDISKAGIEYRFIIRYRNLRKWELELLRFAIELKTEECNSLLTLLLREAGQADELQQYPEETVFAHKIGYGRPLGLGSVIITIDREEPHNAVFEQPVPQNQEDTWPSWYYKLYNNNGGRNETNQYVRRTLIPWLEMHRFSGTSVCSYPTDADGNIHGYFTSIKNGHLRGRRLSGQGAGPHAGLPEPSLPNNENQPD